MNRQYSTTELSRNWSEISAAAQRRPVTLTRHRKAQFILLNVEDYHALLERAGARRVHVTRDVPDDLASEIEAAIADYEDDPQ
ncbi:MAG: prevent-host-death family protein [Pseudomonadota bacterium]|nr:prevent-host-death family protein [Pseudomonadota bacterium]